MHKLKKTLATICLLTPVVAGALGVGEINLQSALNQQLRAEIPLISSGTEDASNIRISLASPSAFAKAGIERFYFLNSLQFKPLRQNNGNLVVEVTSSEVIREPFLNFLVEVQWPNGRMLREFTVLLDPPSMLAEGTTPIQSAIPVAKKSKPQEPKPSTVTASTLKEAVEPVNKDTVVESSTEVSDKETADVSSTATGGEYGPVSNRDSIWKIAKRVNQNSRIVTHEQMMMALYRANPQAFYRKNISALKTGSVLEIPEQEVILGLSRKDARVAFAQQTESWNAQAGTTTPHQTSSTVETAAKTDKSTGQLELLSASTDSTSGKINVKQNSALLAEARETLVQENEELRSRVVDLENQVKTVERLLALKDEQFAALQNQLQQAKTQASNVPLPEQIINTDPDIAQINESSDVVTPGISNPADNRVPDLVVEPSTPVEDIASDVVAEPDSVENGVTSEPQEPAIDEGGAPVVDDTAVAQSEPVLDSVVKPVAPIVKPAVKVEPPAQKHQVDSEPAEQSLISEFLSEPLYPAATGLGVVLLGLLAFVFSRKRKAGDDEEQADIITAPEDLNDSLLDEDELLAKEIDQASTDDFAQSNLDEDTFLSEFAASDLSTLDTDVTEENDPLSEADVYLAYGRHQQAEDLVRTALNKEPSNEEFKLKLLEIHAAAESQEAFDAYSQELHDSNPTPEFWQKVVAIGAPFSPQNPLFGGEADTLENDISAVSEMDIPQDETNVQQEEDAFEFDLTEAYGDLNASSDLETDQNPEANTPDNTEGDSINLNKASEQSFMNEEIVDDSKSELSDLQASVADNLDFDMSFLNEDTEIGGEATESSLSSFSPTSEGIDFDLDSFNMPAEESEISTFGDVSDEFPELTDMDEVETKLDLAKAYVDMEDNESAREILDDVLGKGSDAQRQEAEQLIKKLASN